jgi:PTH2 family peptidyl-tRNA hydrolase
MDMKQVIVVRKDLKMGAGKAAAMVAHGSLQFLRRHVAEEHETGDWYLDWDQALWLLNSQAKVILRVDSLEELLAVKAAAEELFIETHLVVDAGLTKFHGEPTVTCVCLGPDLCDKLDAVTGHLKLY